MAASKARFISVLERAHEKGHAVAVYADENDFQSYEVGFVEYVDAHELMLMCLTPKGEPDGKRGIRTEDIARIDAENAYTKKLELLYQYRDSVFDPDFRPSASGGSDLRNQLLKAREDGVLVHLVDSNDFGPTGFVREVGEDFVDLERIGNHGEPDGQCTVLMHSISKVHIGRRQEQVLEFLNRYNHGLRKLLE